MGRLRSERTKGAREDWSSALSLFQLDPRESTDENPVVQVSKGWRKLSLDGQLWSTAPSTSSIGADVLSTESIFSLFDQSGTFVKTLDLRGFEKSLEGPSLHRIIQGATAFQVDGSTSFTVVNLTGKQLLPSCTPCDC